MESRIDWLTLTIKPESENISYNDIFHALEHDLLLGDLISKMVIVPRVAHYETCLGYENITLCIPSFARYREQGFCLRLSSQGLDFFVRYLDTYNINLKMWLGRFRGLCFEGFVTRCTRWDYAMDDICRNGDKPTITMKKIIACSRKGEMCKKARFVYLFNGDGVTVNECFKVVGGDPLVGLTLNVGSRFSKTFCRFYDKLAQQLQKKHKVDDDITSWTRCEFEFKDSEAMCVLNAYVDFDDEHFSNHMCGVVNNYVSFIVRNNDNISRCPVKRWWTKFLGGCTEKFKLIHRLPARSAYARAKRGLNQYLAILYTLYKELGIVGVVKFFKKQIDEKIAQNPKCDLYKPELSNNIRDGRLDYENMSGYKYYYYNTWESPQYIKPKHLKLKPIRLKQLNVDHSIVSFWDYPLDFQCFNGIVRRPVTYRPALVEINSNRGAFLYAHKLKGYELERHLAFMDGCEVLT